ncbi:lysophospholipid acyltransferase family protein [Hymenobacter sp. BT770]|uniref:lysophospholipid acyltransferase family protein n=1 Tax=Hymenobacter sp. BT770 TaxID=2886942 RepID=UPI001D10DE21|nr:lysophospholipid acyltransferase family protein [Hymenobacter sp. BT770]MCC3155287.1 lysophospholipid acyltransferase family protein [Hymenobacter sp. BT770]MDO3417248.1 lysophospholipid acyltransferase family protein [Hymenobacter sp. BT770]
MSEGVKAPKRPYSWAYVPLRWLLLGLAHLPLSVLYVVADGVYLLLAYVVRYRQRVVLENLRNSFPDKPEAEIQRICKAFYRHFSQVVVEIIRLPAMPPMELRQRMVMRNPEVADRHFAEGRTVLGLASHAGNWEWVLAAGPLWLAAPIDGVYKPLSNPFFEEFLRFVRSRTGAGLVPMSYVMREMVAHRGEAHLLSLVSDQAAGPEDRPYWTQFLNQDSGFYTSTERLATRFHCAVLYVGIRRRRRGYYEFEFTELYDGTSPLPTGDAPIMEAFARKLEKDIQAAPEQYLWTHRRWKHKR